MIKPVACMATIPPRHKELKLACQSLLPQVDRLFIYFNGFTQGQVPLWAKSISKITWACSNEFGDLGDVGKFFFCSDEMKGQYGIEGTVFTCDDDIVYPSWFVQKIQHRLGLTSKSKRILTYHGAKMKPQCYDYGRHKVTFHIAKTVKQQTRVNIGGTGCMGFDLSTFQPSLEMFEAPNMADIFVARWALLNDVEIYVLPHRRGDFQILHVEETIWSSTSTKDGSSMDRSEMTNSIISSLAWPRV